MILSNFRIEILSIRALLYPIGSKGLNTLNHTKMYHKETLFLSFFRFDRRSPKYVLLRLRGNHYSPTNHSSL